MKKKIIQIILFSILCVFVSCKGKESQNQFEAKPIVKTVGKIDVMIDPNVEMMMILGRLGNIVPFGKNEWNTHLYLDKVDEYFAPYANHKALYLTNNAIAYQRLPEFGMYLKDDLSDFIMKIDDENFVVMDGPAKYISYYKSKQYLEAVKDFRISTKFDNFFMENVSAYEKMIERFETILLKAKLDVWIEEFYGKEIEDNIKLYLTHVGGNFGITFTSPDGKKIPHSVILANEKENEAGFLFLLSHEFSHPMTKEIIEELYKNEKIQKKFASVFNNNSSVYSMNGYPSGFYVFNETINQACSNKAWEKMLAKESVEHLNKHTVQKQKMIYVPAIAEFLDNYQNNRDKYKTLEDFISELEKFILTLE